MDLLTEYAKLIKQEEKKSPSRYQLTYEHYTADINIDQVSVVGNTEPVYDIGREEPVAHVSRKGIEIYFTTIEPVENPHGVIGIRIHDRAYEEISFLQEEHSHSSTSQGEYAVYSYAYVAQKYTMLRRN